LNFTFYSSRTFEHWDWTTPLEVGIGGSETSHAEMAQRLAKRGHHVFSFAPIGKEGTYFDGVYWYASEEVAKQVNHPEPDQIFVIYREPAMADMLPECVPSWLVCQDVAYKTMTPARAAKFTRIIALCEDHANHLRVLWPFASDKVCVSSNGIRSDRIRSLYEERPCPDGWERNPKRLMYASSPDRGLSTLLDIFGRLREIVSDVELHVFYGFNNLEKCANQFPNQPERGRQIFAENQRLVEALKAPGIIHHGRIGQRAMIDEWLQSGIWCHPSEFTETSCITCMDAQACGAIPVTTPIWAIGENVQHGVMIEGFPKQDPLTRARYVNELVKLVQDPERQYDIRFEMMPWALQHFNWENFVTQWEGWAAEDMARLGREVAA
jgi:glycosyltransferase involved in cell wall biosynthesis